MRCLFLVLLFFLSGLSFAEIQLRTSRAQLYPKKEHSFFDLGQTSFEFGLNYSSFKDRAIQKTYEDFYRSSGALIPSFRMTQFIGVERFLNLGFGFQFGYFRKKGPTMDENDNYHEENQILVYIPYQAFMDINLASGKGFDFDLWVGYKESFIENRREVEEGATYISRKGKHWNSFVSVGLGSSFSLKRAANPAFFAGQYPFGLRDILVKIFYETDFNLYNDTLWGNRTVLKNNNYEQRSYGLAFLFKL